VRLPNLDSGRWNVKVATLVVVVLCLAVLLPAQSGPLYSANGRIPLGIESLRLEPAGQPFYLIASAQNPEFEGLYRRAGKNERVRLFDADDKPVLFYPSRVQFRLTASSREKLMEMRPFDTHAKISLDDLFTRLQFRVKVFHALEYRFIKPAYVENVGVPKNVPYNERIYRIGFDLGKIPIDDRVVMEVISPTGERLCKFHLDLF
jgi:hypothetical protein